MRLRFGRYAGVTAETVLLRVPDYVEWVLKGLGPGRLGIVFADLVDRFDAKALRTPCIVCGAPATRAFVYPGQARVLAYCPACTADIGRRDDGALRPVDGFWPALRHVNTTFRRRRREGKRQIIRALVKLKGGPARITEASAIRFLNV